MNLDLFVFFPSLEFYQQDFETISVFGYSLFDTLLLYALFQDVYTLRR